MLDRVFVYGTLQQGQPNHHLVAPFVRHVIPGSIAGTLLDLGTYPGWVEGPGTVHGQVLHLLSPQLALPQLDDLEDYLGPRHPANLYHRVVVKVRTPAGESRAWAYRYAASTTTAVILPGGRWPASP